MVISQTMAFKGVISGFQLHTPFKLIAVLSALFISSVFAVPMKSHNGVYTHVSKPVIKQQLCNGLCICDKPIKHVNCTDVGIVKLTDIAIPKSVMSLLLDKNSISIVPKGIFQKLPNLKFLGISSNNISKIEPQSICSGNQLIHIILNFNYISEIPDGFFKDCSHLKTLQLKVNYLIIEEFAKCLPSLPNLDELDLSNNQFQNSSILPEEFSTLKNLQYLYLDYIDIHNLSDDFFNGLNTSNLIELSLVKNLIMKVSNKSFSNMESLELLDLSYTHITVQNAVDIFYGLSNSRRLKHLNLKYLFVDGNKEDMLTHHFFRNIYNSSLKVLHMEGNYGGFHGTLSKSFFAHLHHLQQLYLDHNELKTIHPKAFNRLHRLKKLSLSKNYLSCLVDCQFLQSIAMFPALEDLDLSNNIIDDSAGYVSFSSAYLPKLKHLNLRNNRIAAITEFTFHSLKNVRTLDLSQNPIYMIDPGSFNGFVRLKSLIIEDCYHITSLQRLVFAGLTNLETLKLNGNGIRSVHNDALYGLTSLLQLEMRNNHLGVGEGSINSFYNLSMPSHNLSLLDLSYNNIEVLPERLFRNETHLTVLNINHNRIVQFNGSHLLDLKHLKKLDLSYNDILTIPQNTLFGLENLTDLNLEGNPFYCDCELKPSQQWLINNHKIVRQQGNTKCAGPSNLAGTQMLVFKAQGWHCEKTTTLIMTFIILVIVVLLIILIQILYKYRNSNSTRNNRNNGSDKQHNNSRNGITKNSRSKELKQSDSQVAINSIETVDMISQVSEQTNGDCTSVHNDNQHHRPQHQNTDKHSGCFSLSDVFKKRKGSGCKKNGVISSGHEPLIETQSTI